MSSDGHYRGVAECRASDATSGRGRRRRQDQASLAGATECGHRWSGHAGTPHGAWTGQHGDDTGWVDLLDGWRRCTVRRAAEVKTMSTPSNIVKLKLNMCETICILKLKLTVSARFRIRPLGPDSAKFSANVFRLQKTPTFHSHAQVNPQDSRPQSDNLLTRTS